jgi:hypothetical protein
MEKIPLMRIRMRMIRISIAGWCHFRALARIAKINRILALLGETPLPTLGIFSFQAKRPPENALFRPVNC